MLAGQVALGGATFSLVPHFPRATAVAVIRAAADAAVRVFDAARAYAPVGDPTHNETLLATALAGRDDVLIGTKGGHLRTGPREWDVDNSPARLRQDVDDSLRALGLGAGREATAVDSAAAMAEVWDDEAQTAYDADRTALA